MAFDRGNMVCMYVRMYVRMYVHTVTYLSHSGMLITLGGFSACQLSFYLPRGLDSARFTTLRFRSVDKHAVRPGLAEI